LKKSIIIIGIIIAILIAIIVVMGIKLNAKTKDNVNVSNNNEITKVRVTEVTRSLFYAPQYAAIALGYFEEEGIKVDLTTGSGADSVMTAVLSRSI